MISFEYSSESKEYHIDSNGVMVRSHPKHVDDLIEGGIPLTQWIFVGGILIFGIYQIWSNYFVVQDPKKRAKIVSSTKRRSVDNIIKKGNKRNKASAKRKHKNNKTTHHQISSSKAVRNDNTSFNVEDTQVKNETMKAETTTLTTTTTITTNAEDVKKQFTAVRKKSRKLKQHHKFPPSKHRSAGHAQVTSNSKTIESDNNVPDELPDCISMDESLSTMTSEEIHQDNTSTNLSFAMSHDGGIPENENMATSFQIIHKGGKTIPCSLTSTTMGENDEIDDAVVQEETYQPPISNETFTEVHKSTVPIEEAIAVQQISTSEADAEANGIASESSYDLDEENDPSARRQGGSLAWKDVQIKLKNEKILLNVNGEALANKVTAIMGPSEMEKKYLLHVLCGQLHSHGSVEVNAHVEMNGNKVEPYDSVLEKNTAFIGHEDSSSLEATITPREAIRFAVKLRLPSKTTQKQVDKVTDNLLEALNLTKCANTIIGRTDLIPGISKGERIRTLVGVEMAARPTIIFLEDPSNTLDLMETKELFQILKNVANNGVSIVCTINNPPSEIFHTLDRLVLLNQRKIEYNGNTDDVLFFFSERGYEGPQNEELASWLMKTLDALSNSRKQDAADDDCCYSENVDTESINNTEDDENIAKSLQVQESSLDGFVHHPQEEMNWTTVKTKR